jgi:hypothetical protein
MIGIEELPAIFIVTEHGGGWPGSFGSRGRHVVALPQVAGERLAPLVARVTSSLTGLRERAIEVGRAYLVCNQRLDAAALAARVMIASALLDAMRQARGGRLVLLAGDPPLTPALRIHLLDLAEALTLDARDPSVRVSSAFGARSALPKRVRRRAGAAQLPH